MSESDSGSDLDGPDSEGHGHNPGKLFCHLGSEGPPLHLLDSKSKYI